jgi:CDP-diacylglycerol--glycerol-3-phosphate 3-phosphatidyltransferase
MTRPWQKKLPMWITLSRMALALPILVLMSYEGVSLKWVSCLLFALASITDYYDGYFARKFNATSNMGKFMDPVADKILVSAILVMLVVHKLIDPYMVVLIITRDTLIGGLRSVAAADQIVIAAKSAGKWKTALQMSAIPFLILGPQVWTKYPIHQWAYGALWISTILSLTSGWEYLQGYKVALSNLKLQK